VIRGSFEVPANVKSLLPQLLAYGHQVNQNFSLR
jgi:hypothetical protein